MTRPPILHDQNYWANELRAYAPTPANDLQQAFWEVQGAFQGLPNPPEGVVNFEDLARFFGMLETWMDTCASASVQGFSEIWERTKYRRLPVDAWGIMRNGFAEIFAVIDRALEPPAQYEFPLPDPRTHQTKEKAPRVLHSHYQRVGELKQKKADTAASEDERSYARFEAERYRLLASGSPARKAILQAVNRWNRNPKVPQQIRGGLQQLQRRLDSVLADLRACLPIMTLPPLSCRASGNKVLFYRGGDRAVLPRKPALAFGELLVRHARGEPLDGLKEPRKNRTRAREVLEQSPGFKDLLVVESQNSWRINLPRASVNVDAIVNLFKDDAAGWADFEI